MLKFPCVFFPIFKQYFHSSVSNSQIFNFDLVKLVQGKVCLHYNDHKYSFRMLKDQALDQAPQKEEDVDVGEDVVEEVRG